MQPKRGHLVVIKMGVDTFFSDPRMEAKERFQPGDEGRVVTRTKNGWLRVRICRTGWVVRVRNGPTRIEKPFQRKVVWDGNHGVPATVFAWWVPLKIEKVAAREASSAAALAALAAVRARVGYLVKIETPQVVRTHQMYLSPHSNPPMLQKQIAFKQSNLCWEVDEKLLVGAKHKEELAWL